MGKTIFARGREFFVGIDFFSFILFTSRHSHDRGSLCLQKDTHSDNPYIPEHKRGNCLL